MSKALDVAVLAAKLERSQWHPMWSADAKAKMVERNPSRVGADAVTLIRLSASLRGIAERQCNGDAPKCQMCLGDGQCGNDAEGYAVDAYECPDCQGTGHDTRREKRLCVQVTETLKPYGLTWKHNTDPRGAAVGILFPDGSYNTMGGAEEGWRI